MTLARRLARGGAALTLVAAVSVVPQGASAQARTDQIRIRQWHLDEMRVPKAWRWSRGAGVMVAVLDTGVDRRHPDLEGRVVSGPDLTGGTRRPGGRFWGLHGTSMASIISGHGHGPGQQEGVIGVAPQSRVLSVRVTWENDDPLRKDGGETGRNRDTVAQGIRYAVDQGAKIINMSLGGGRQFYDGSSSEESAIKYALSRGVVLIASAGNDGSGPNRKNFPAAYPGVIAVGALDRGLRLWKDSNRRPYVAVCAPGVEIVSADAEDGYVVGTGTSPSSAIVAGVAALVRAKYPALTPEQVRQALVQSVRPVPAAAPCKGTVDAVRAMTVANRLSKGSPGLGAAPRTAGSSAPLADSGDQDDGPSTLLVGVLAGGSVLVLFGLFAAWRQRRGGLDEEYEDDEDDYFPEPPPRAPVSAMAGGSSPFQGPVNAPLWQSNEVLASDPRPPWPPPKADAAEQPTWSVPPGQDQPDDTEHRPPWW
ncbi:S8 family peptidase [Spirillospora sp. CA-294931]|uniref:S8 family peptidase n=1 Tax=Spirillospora sp. CA-294931 TaxID=3240042 RepID=UPI003D8F5C12